MVWFLSDIWGNLIVSVYSSLLCLNNYWSYNETLFFAFFLFLLHFCHCNKIPWQEAVQARKDLLGLYFQVTAHHFGEINLGIQCIISRVKKGKKTKPNHNNRMDPCLLLLSLLLDRPGTGLWKGAAHLNYQVKTPSNGHAHRATWSRQFIMACLGDSRLC